MDGIAFLGGLGLLLYGMRLLGDSMGSAAPTVPTRLGVAGCALWGALLALLTQSSGPVTLFAVSAAGEGILRSPQAVALCWGANLGTTVTGHLLRLGQGRAAAVAPLACFAGAALYLAGRERLRAAGQTVLALGLTLTGLHSLQTAAAPLLAGVELAGQAGACRSVLLGAALAAALQSGSAAVALLQAAAAKGGVTLGRALPLVMGANLGACATALVAAVASGKAAARHTALGHLAFNAAGTAAGLALLALTPSWEGWRQPLGLAGVARLQTGFNAATLAVLLPILCAGTWKTRKEERTCGERDAETERENSPTRPVASPVFRRPAGKDGSSRCGT